MDDMRETIDRPKVNADALAGAVKRAMASDMLDEFLTAYVKRLNDGLPLERAVQGALAELKL